MLTKPIRLFLAALALCLSVQPLPAAEMTTLAPRIMVNDQVISALEVEMRTKLALITSGLQDSPETRAFLARQVEQQLIDEKLQLQEAERLGVTVEEEAVEQTFAQVAQSNGMSAEVLRQRLRGAGVLPEYLSDQIRAQMLWRAVLRQEVLPRVTLTDEDVDDAVARIQERSGEQERLLAEIVLPVDNAGQTQEVVKTAEEVLQQIRRGAGFQALARQFSESPTAEAGGDLGWVEPGVLPAEVEAVVQKMQVGTLSEPIVTPRAVYIMLLRDKRPQPERKVTVTLKMITFRVSSFENRNAVNQAAGRAVQAAKALTCDSADAVAKRFGGRLADIPPDTSVASLPGSLRTAISGLPNGKASDLFRASDGIGVAVVCDRTDGGVDRELVRERLLSEQVDRLARRYMQDLRRLATVEMRG